MPMSGVSRRVTKRFIVSSQAVRDLNPEADSRLVGIGPDFVQPLELLSAYASHVLGAIVVLAPFKPFTVERPDSIFPPGMREFAN